MRASAASSLLIFLVVLLANVPALAQQSDASTWIRLTISSKNPSVAAGGPVPITFLIENTTPRKLHYVYQDHDVQGNVLPYPVGLKARVTDESGRVLTENDVSNDTWWSWYDTWAKVMLASRNSRERLTLGGHKKLERTVDLNTVLKGLPALASGLPAGSYTIQFSLRGVESNEIRLDVRGQLDH